MDKKQALIEFFRGNVTPLLRLKVANRKDVRVMIGLRNAEQPDNISLSVTYRNGKNERLEGVTEQQFNALADRVIEHPEKDKGVCLLFTVPAGLPPLYTDESDILEP